MGGNIFKESASSIPKELIEETVITYFEDLKILFPQKANIFNKKHFKYLGSVGKKDLSGDIDFGIDASSIIDKKFSNEDIKKWNIDPEDVQSKFEILKKRARTATDDDLMMKAILFNIAIKMNTSNRIRTEEKKTGHGTIFGCFPQISNNVETGKGVQIDWMIGNIDWLQFSYYSTTYKGTVKGLHRTQLILAMFQHLNLAFSHLKGVTDKKTKNLIAKTPNEAIQLLEEGFKIKLSKEIIQDYFKIQKVINELPNKIQKSIYDIYLKILDSTRADIPNDLQEYWIKEQTNLQLKGKFLPMNSNLIEYQKG